MKNALPETGLQAHHIIEQRFAKELGLNERTMLSVAVTKEELETADCYVMKAKWLFKYPQPEDDFAYEHTTYKADSGCRECGVGLVQAQSFSVRGQPT